MTTPQAETRVQDVPPVFQTGPAATFQVWRDAVVAQDMARLVALALPEARDILRQQLTDRTTKLYQFLFVDGHSVRSALDPVHFLHARHLRVERQRHWRLGVVLLHKEHCREKAWHDEARALVQVGRTQYRFEACQLVVAKGSDSSTAMARRYPLMSPPAQPNMQAHAALGAARGSSKGKGVEWS